MKTSAVILLAVFALPLVPTRSSAQQTFTFAGYAFDQRNTPDQGVLLGNGALLGEAQFSAGLPRTTTGTILGFPEASAGFNGALGLANIVGLGGSGPKAVNLPDGNNGTAMRQGIEVWWSNQRGLPNLPGNDFVVFESASSKASVEGVMARAHSIARSLGQPARWTDWHYFPPAGFHLTMGVEGAFADVFDLSLMGLSEDAIVDHIQIANLTQADRIAGPGETIRPGVTVAFGRVVFDGSSDAIPDAGPFDPDRVFDSTTYDPDPLYLAAFHDTVSLPPVFKSISAGPEGIALEVETAPGNWIIESTDAIDPTNWQLVEAFSSAAGGVTKRVDHGQNGRPAPAEVGSRFYRVSSPRGA
ncbi:MAG: hypothetical protein HYR88_03780 [Verrucomicrobia bacterium]|nr:hypothetical protein [Verrucomicrobiota bacterium]MBI3869711.1 hypothetical protein [Verrucomicrobiota bacterium]